MSVTGFQLWWVSLWSKRESITKTRLGPGFVMPFSALASQQKIIIHILAIMLPSIDIGPE
jgi:hypothetical protein